MEVAEAAKAAAKKLEEALGAPPAAAVVLGSGLGVLADALESPRRIPYGELGFALPSVAGHAGTLLHGRLGGSPVVLLSGRVHAYEGRSPEEIARAVRALALWGVPKVVLTNAAGAIDPGLRIGQIVAMSDHLDFTGANPVVGPENGLGPRFFDLSRAYSPELRAQARQVAAEQGWELSEGIYAAMRGPSYETPAEVRMLGRMGAHMVGMSTVPEAIALTQMGIPVLAFSLISNLAAGLATSALHHAEVMEAAAAAGPRLARLIAELVKRWGTP